VIAVHAFFNFISLENTAQIVHAPYYAAGIWIVPHVSLMLESFLWEVLLLSWLRGRSKSFANKIGIGKFRHIRLDQGHRLIMSLFLGFKTWWTVFLWVQCGAPELRFLKCSIKWDVLTFWFSPVSASLFHSFYSLENTTLSLAYFPPSLTSFLYFSP
jgi:hypothetical protein